jgi:hypothetical protein
MRFAGKPRPAFLLTMSAILVLMLGAVPKRTCGNDFDAESVPESLPTELSLKQDVPQTYNVTTLWNNRDANGNATGKFIISAEYTRGLPGDSVRWNNVMIEIFQNPTGSASDTVLVQELEDFTYQSPVDIARPDFFASFPADESRHLLQTLIWDAVGIEVFAWNFWESLQLNRPFRPA